MRFTQNDLVRRSQNTALFWSLPTIGFSVAFTRTNTKPHPASSTLKFCCQGFFAFFVLEATAALVLTEAEADGLEKEAPSFLFMARGRRRWSRMVVCWWCTSSLWRPIALDQHHWRGSEEEGCRGVQSLVLVLVVHHFWHETGYVEVVGIFTQNLLRWLKVVAKKHHF